MNKVLIKTENGKSKESSSQTSRAKPDFNQSVDICNDILKKNTRVSFLQSTHVLPCDELE